MRRSLFALVLVVAASALVHAVRSPRPAAARPAAEPVLVPFAIDAARVLTVVDSVLLVCNAADVEEPMVLEELLVSANGVVLETQSLDVELRRDPRFAELNAMVERMPAELTHLHRDRRYFAAPDAAPYPFAELADRWAEIDARSEALRADYLADPSRPFVELHFALPLDQVFFPDDAPGTVREVEMAVRYRRGGTSAMASTVHTLTLLAPRLPAPRTLAFTLGDVTVHAGDLHVHSCHGEAVNACAPSGDCAAESFQTSGSFTYAQLKSQYQALGYDWFTATDHSYCINSTSEYQTIVAETTALTDGAFVMIPDIELSSEEQGAQSGSDFTDILCLLGPEQNHMGAHGITSRKEGGSDGFLGFCNGLFSDALDGFLINASRVRAEGGYPIAHHPTADSFAWNSTTSTLGIEGNQMHGIEVWNGASISGQGGDVGDWVGRLLRGNILYAYSGSDTHDAAFAFGADHAVFVNEPFTEAGLESVLKRGRVFLSNGHVLILEVEVDGQSLLMGALQSLSPTQPASPLTTRVHFDFGAATSTITVFKGRVGDGAETVLCTSPPLTGTGIFEWTDTLDPTARTYYRAYCETSGATTVAYTNPVFFLPGSCGYTPYGTGLGGANVATLASFSNPAIGSMNRFDAVGFSPAATTAFFVYSQGSIPGGLPLAGGFLLVTLPQDYLRTAPVTAGTASIIEQIPFDPAFVGATVYWQAAALDPAQPNHIAFTNGLAMTVCDILN